MTLSKSAEQCVHYYCDKGCKIVLEVIAELEAGQSVERISDLSVPDQKAVLEELKTIMSVYDNQCKL